MQDNFLTIAEVANLLRLNQQTVRNWIDRGDLPAVRIGPRRVRVRESDLERLIAAGETTPIETEREPISAGETEGPPTEPWARLGSALAESSAALTDEDHAELAQALTSLADAATTLARVLGVPVAERSGADPTPSARS